MTIRLLAVGCLLLCGGHRGKADDARTHTSQVRDLGNFAAAAEPLAQKAPSLGLGAGGPAPRQIGAMNYEEVFAAVQKGGDPAVGKEIYQRAGCMACHGITRADSPKGPILSAVAKRNDRAALTESILKPNAKIARGFETVWFKTKKGGQIEGVIFREGDDSLDVRNSLGQSVRIQKSDITERGKRKTSIMPEVSINAFSPWELASLLAYLESLKAVK